MLPKLVLTLLQIHVGWTYGPLLTAMIPANLGTLGIFLLAVVVAILVWLVGHVGALVLKDTPPPTNATLTVVLLLALLFATLTLVPAVPAAIAGTLKLRVPTVAYPLVGAMLGYLLKR
jgi:hypothetical protein